MATPAAERTDLRHMTSAAHLQRSPHRPAQLARLGSRSPSSIPSSPTSVRSSSSAIFERDIEPLVCSPPIFHAHQNPHRIPRAKGTEQLEHAVPSVLDSAASVLATLDDSTDVAVVAPACSTSATTSPGFPASSGFASPIGSFRSRSPSPLGLRVAPGHGGPMGRTELLLNIPNQGCSNTSTRSTPAAMTAPQPFFSPSSPPNTVVSPLLPAIIPPAPNASDSGSGGAAAATCEPESVGQVTSSTLPSHAVTHHSTSNPSTTSPSVTTHRPSHSSPVSITTTTTTTTTTSPMVLSSHPPSPTTATMNVPTKRLSFMSYSDLLTSTPSSLVSLSSLTSAASSMDPPPHIPCVNGYTPPVGIFGGSTSSPVSYFSNSKGPTSNSATTSLRGFAIGNTAGKKENNSVSMMDDNSGGEWEREGLGRGLEERLEALIQCSTVATSPMSREQQQRSTSFGSAHYPVLVGR